MARGFHQDSSTDITASSSEDEGGTQRKKRRTKKCTTIHIGGRENQVAVGSGARITTTTAAAAATTDITDAEKILKNPDDFFKEVAKCGVTEKNKMEKYICQHLLPYIEEHAIKMASSRNDDLEILAGFCSRDLKSPRITMQSLKTMTRLLDLEFGNCESPNAHIIEVERILRQPFVDGSFAEEPQHDQRRRVEVYNSVLALILLYIAKGHLKHPYVNKTEKEEIRESVTKNIKKSLQRNPLPKKDRWRFSMETALLLIERLFDYKKMSQMTKLLDLWKDNTLEVFPEKLQCTESRSVDRFVILKMFHGKLCNNDGDAFRIVQLIIMNHDVFSKQWQHRNEDWQFVLLACQTLLHTINNHKLSKATRTQAADCLASLMAVKAFEKSDVIRSIIEEHCIKTSFARDLKSRMIVMEKIFNQKALEEVQVEQNVLIKQICKIHESKGLEYIETICVDGYRLVVRGLYDYQPVAITVVIINPIRKLYSAQDQDLSLSEKDLHNEVEVLQHLNQTANEHVLMMHTADTKIRPYHMICEYMPKEDLLYFLKVRKEEQELPTYRQLLEIVLKIAKCMIFIHGKQVIHNKLRPDHVLLDDHFNVRLTGFGGAKILSENEMQHGIHGEKLSYEDPSIRFAAPECLEDEPLLSPESEVWAFGVLMYVVFTCGGTPYANQDTKDIHQHVLSGRTLTKEQFMRDEIFSLIQKCMGKLRNDRISFTKISEELQKLLADCIGKGGDERIRIPEPMKDEDINNDIPMEQENASSVSNTTEVLGSPLEKMQRPRRTTSRKQSLVDSSKGHLEKLRALDHPHLARVVKHQKTRSGRQVTYENCDGPSLRNYILNNNCTPENVVRFAAQITEAINYLHSKNIILCVLNAESIKVVGNNHVKIFGLHFSRSVLPYCDESNISYGVVHGKVDPDIYRWCAKEVIQDGLFSRAGDVWSLGMTILEMFLCLAKDADAAIPFSQYSDEEILETLKTNSRPAQPAQCPDWVYVLVTQCWCLHGSERTSSLSVLDCLTQRCPWQSYVLQCWLRKNEIHENWPDMNAVQQLNGNHNISRQDVESSVTDEFTDYHSYEYERPFWLKKVFRSLVTTGRRWLMPSSRPSRSGPRPSTTHGLSNASSVPSLSSSSHLAPSHAIPSPVCDYYNIGLMREQTDIKKREEKGKDDDNDDDTYDRPIPSVNELTCATRARPISLPPRPLLPTSPNETLPDIKQKEEKGEDDDDNDDTYDRPIPSVNEVTCDNHMYDDIYDRPRIPANEVTCRPRSRSLPPLPLPQTSPQETISDIQQKEEKEEDGDMYDDVYGRSGVPANEVTCRPRSRSLPPLPLPKTSPQETISDIKQKEEKEKEEDEPNGNLDQDTNPPDPEPQVNLSCCETYQELSYSTEEGYTPLVRDSNPMIEGCDPNTSTYVNVVDSGNGSDNNTMNYKQVFYMNL